MKRLSTALLFTAAVFILPSVASAQQKECVSTQGNVACGYDCKTTQGNARCANTPSGACITTQGRIFCTEFNERRAWNWPKAHCVTTQGTGACGYDCKTTQGKAKCAQTPNGVCHTSQGQIYCSD